MVCTSGRRRRFRAPADEFPTKTVVNSLPFLGRFVNLACLGGPTPSRRRRDAGTALQSGQNAKCHIRPRRNLPRRTGLRPVAPPLPMREGPDLSSKRWSRLPKLESGAKCDESQTKSGANAKMLHNPCPPARWGSGEARIVFIAYYSTRVRCCQ